MLNAIYKLGESYIEKENIDKMEVLVDNKKIGAVITINLIDEGNGVFSYDKVIQEDFNENNLLKYLYKKGSSRGTDITPSCLITDPEKTFNNKFFKWISNNQDKNDFLKGVFNCIDSNKDEIFEDLVKIHSDINLKDSNILLTLTFLSDDVKKYIGDYEFFRDILKENAEEKYYKKGSKKIKGNGVCFLCDGEKEVLGLVSSAIGFAFSTPEKEGNVPSNLMENQWKLLPICVDCALFLESGKKFIEEYMDFKEFGLSFYAIPNFIFDSEEGFTKLYKVLSRFQSENAKVEDLTLIENKLQYIVRNMEDIVEFKFLFYESSNNAFDILAYVESIIPSWLNNLYETQNTIQGYDFFQEDNLKYIYGKDHAGDFIDWINKNEKYYKCNKKNWYQKFLRDFISSFSKKMYIDTVVDVLSQKRLDYDFLLSRFMHKIRRNWRNQEHTAYKTAILKSLMLFTLFDKLNLLRGNTLNIVDDEFNIENLLDTPSKRAAFLTGVLTRKLMNIQYNELKSTPFYNKLYGLSLDEKKIKKIYLAAFNKLREYGAAFPKLEEELSLNFTKAENNWNLKRDETSYFFLLGHTLYKKIEF